MNKILPRKSWTTLQFMNPIKSRRHLAKARWSQDILINVFIPSSQEHGHRQGLRLQGLRPLRHGLHSQRSLQVRSSLHLHYHHYHHHSPQVRHAGECQEEGNHGWSHRWRPLLHRGHHRQRLHRQDLQQTEEAQARARWVQLSSSLGSQFLLKLSNDFFFEINSEVSLGRTGWQNITEQRELFSVKWFILFSPESGGSGRHGSRDL